MKKRCGYPFGVTWLHSITRFWINACDDSGTSKLNPFYKHYLGDAGGHLLFEAVMCARKVVLALDSVPQRTKVDLIPYSHLLRHSEGNQAEGPSGSEIERLYILKRNHWKL